MIFTIQEYNNNVISILCTNVSVSEIKSAASNLACDPLK